MLSKNEFSRNLQELNDAESDVTDEINSYEELLNEASKETHQVWLDAVDNNVHDDNQANVTTTWLVEDNPDALSDYMQEVADVVLPEGIDW